MKFCCHPTFHEHVFFIIEESDVTIDDKINLFFLIRFISENLSKLAHRELAQFIRASDASEEINMVKCPPLLFKERPHLSYTLIKEMCYHLAQFEP